MQIRIRKYPSINGIIRYDQPLSDESLIIRIGLPYVIFKDGVATVYELTEPPDKPGRKTR